MSIIPLLALPAGLEMTAFSRQQGTLCVSVLSTQSCSQCPVCGSASTRIHSRYQRRLADLPSAGQPVRFLLTVRKFFCDAPTCPRKIFAERLTPFVAPGARVTARLFQMVQIRGARDPSSTPPKPSRIGPDVYSRAGVCQIAAHTHRGKPCCLAGQSRCQADPRMEAASFWGLNAGISGGASGPNAARKEWDRRSAKSTS